ncbi:MAG: hypothetical protein AAB210_03025 [Deltaproteobacteria bacterium]
MRKEDPFPVKGEFGRVRVHVRAEEFGEERAERKIVVAFKVGYFRSELPEFQQRRE